jgi:hypothetical protein
VTKPSPIPNVLLIDYARSRSTAQPFSNASAVMSESPSALRRIPQAIQARADKGAQQPASLSGVCDAKGRVDFGRKERDLR